MGRGSGRLLRAAEPECVSCRKEVGLTVSFDSAMHMVRVTLTERFLPLVSPRGFTMVRRTAEAAMVLVTLRRSSESMVWVLEELRRRSETSLRAPVTSPSEMSLRTPATSPSERCLRMFAAPPSEMSLRAPARSPSEMSLRMFATSSS